MRPNVGGDYKIPKGIFANVGGDWKQVEESWVNVGGIWRRSYAIPGIEWTPYEVISRRRWKSIAYGNNIFVAVASGVISGTSDANRIAYSEDGKVWNTVSGFNREQWSSVCFGGDRFVAVANNGSTGAYRKAYSLDGVNWVGVDPFPPNVSRHISVAYGDGRFVAVYQWGSNIQVSSDGGVTWTTFSIGTTTDFHCISYGNGRFVTLRSDGNEGSSFVSTDGGETWTIHPTPTIEIWTAIHYDENVGLFIAGSIEGSIMTSPDGVDWTMRVSPQFMEIRSITSGNGMIVACGRNDSDKPKVFTSYDGINWVSRSAILPLGSEQLDGVTFGNDKFVAVTDYPTENPGDRGVVISEAVY